MKTTKEAVLVLKCATKLLSSIVNPQLGTVSLHDDDSRCVAGREFHLTSSTLNYLPSEFEQRDKVEFTHSFHLTRSDSCFSRRRLDISMTSSRQTRKHSPGTGRQLSLLNLAATKKQILDMTQNKTLADG